MLWGAPFVHDRRRDCHARRTSHSIYIRPRFFGIVISSFCLPKDIPGIL